MKSYDHYLLLKSYYVVMELIEIVISYFNLQYLLFRFLIRILDCEIQILLISVVYILVGIYLQYNEWTFFIYNVYNDKV